jgi:phosphatidylglycerophosphate synthase
MTFLNISYRDFRKKALKQEDTWWCTHVLRHVSTRLSYAVVCLFPNVTPNQLTVIAGLTGLIGAVILALPAEKYLIFGSLILLLWTFLDAVDGEVARFQKSYSLVGAYLDNFFDHIIFACIFLSLTIHMLLIQASEYLVILGLITTVAFLVARLTIGLRAENLIKRDIGCSKLGGMPRDELRQIREEDRSIITTVGLALVHLYDVIIRNYNLVHFVLLCSIVAVYVPHLVIFDSYIPVVSLPLIVYSIMIVYCIVLPIGFYIQLRSLDTNY